jgi:hypothetical protein
MKKVLFPLAIMSLVALPALASGQSTSKPSAPSKQASAHTKATPPAKAHTVSAEFVSYDAKAKTVTVKDDQGQTSSARLEGKAVNEVAKLKTGEKVMLTYRDNSSGEHMAVTNIQPAKSTSKK